MKVTKQETLYHEDHGATLKHKCRKRIVTLPLLSFSLIFYLGLLFLFYGLFFLFFHPESHPDLWGNHSLHHPFLTWDNAPIMKIITLLFTYNSRITTRYFEQLWLYVNASGGVSGYALNQEWHVWKNYEWWLCHKYDVNYMIMQSNMTMMKRVIINGTVESCMAIYLGMAMEMS